MKHIEIEDKYVPKFGDIVRVNTSSCFDRDYLICIMPDKQINVNGENNYFFDIANINLGGQLTFNGCTLGYFDTIEEASDSEKQELFDFLAKAGKRWNAEKKCLEDIEHQELNLCEILKDCPKGTKFYSTVYGNVEFVGIESQNIEYPIRIKTVQDFEASITEKGWLFANFNGECTLFPSKEQRDWSKWVCPKPDIPIDTLVMSSINKIDWRMRHYAGNRCKCWECGYKSTDDNVEWEVYNYIIPFDKFDPNNIEESLKYDICKSEE